MVYRCDFARLSVFSASDLSPLDVHLLAAEAHLLLAVSASPAVVQVLPVVYPHAVGLQCQPVSQSPPLTLLVEYCPLVQAVNLYSPPSQDHD